MPRIITVGKIIRERFTVIVKRDSSGEKPGAVIFITNGMKNIDRAVIIHKKITLIERRLDAALKASSFLPFARSCVKTGMNAAVIAVSAISVRTRFGIL